MHSRAGIDLPQSLVFETVVSAQTVGGAEGLVTLSARMFLKDLEDKHNTRVLLSVLYNNRAKNIVKNYN